MPSHQGTHPHTFNSHKGHDIQSLISEAVTTGRHTQKTQQLHSDVTPNQPCAWGIVLRVPKKELFKTLDLPS